MLKVWFGLFLLLQCLLVQAGEADYALWKDALNQANHQRDLGNFQEATIEQDIDLPVSADEVLNILADLKSYTVLYPLFDKVNIHKTYQTNTLKWVNEFTAVDLQQLGPYSFEEQYFSALEVDSRRHKIQLKIWQPDEVFITVQMTVSPHEQHSSVHVQTRIQAAQDKLQSYMLNEFKAPTLRLDFLKILLEGGDISFYSECMLKPKPNHVCF